jgi:hypothetical protein
MPTPPGYKIWEITAALTTAASPLVSGWFDTTGYTGLLVAAAIANSTGSTTLTVEGSFDGLTLDSTMAYADTGLPVTASSAPGGIAVVVKHSFVRFRVVQATANATATTIFVQSRA